MSNGYSRCFYFIPKTDGVYRGGGFRNECYYFNLCLFLIIVMFFFYEALNVFFEGFSP